MSRETTEITVTCEGRLHDGTECAEVVVVHVADVVGSLTPYSAGLFCVFRHNWSCVTTDLCEWHAQQARFEASGYLF